jgi:hypothetical protein
MLCNLIVYGLASSLEHSPVHFTNKLEYANKNPERNSMKASVSSFLQCGLGAKQGSLLKFFMKHDQNKSFRVQCLYELQKP